LAVNLLKRSIKVRPSPTLSAGLVPYDVFYVAWNRGWTRYYLSEASPDYHTVRWTTNRGEAKEFDNGEEALTIVRKIKSLRGKNITGIIELYIHTEGDTEYDLDWVI
jgi:hypothetical protein